MFDSHDLVYTHDTKTGKYSGGGYTLKSELLTGGTPPLISLSGGGNKRRNSRRQSESGSDSGSGNESGAIPKVSSIIAGSSSIVIPAGLFLIHGPNRLDHDDVDTSTFNVNNAKIRSFLYNSGSDVSENDGHGDDNGSDTDTDTEDGASNDACKKNGRRDNNVISDDIYTALFKMLSPNESDKKRYWVGSAVTCKRRRKKNLISASSSSSSSGPQKSTRKQKK